MPLGSRFIEAPSAGKSETVVDAGIDFELARDTRLVEEATQFLDHRQWCELIMLGTGDVELALALAQ